MLKLLDAEHLDERDVARMRALLERAVDGGKNS
jgi:hypothetical protein